MTSTWLLVANRTRARILEIESERDRPIERAAFVNPAGRAHERDLDSDAAGRFYGHGEREQAHSATASESLGEHEIDRFVIDLRDYLDHARSFRTYLVGDDDSEERNHQQRGQNYFQSFGSHFRFLLSFSSKVKGFSKSD